MSGRRALILLALSVAWLACRGARAEEGGERVVDDVGVVAGDGVERAADADAGADGISVVHTLPGLVIDTETRKPALGFGTGGVSGPGLMPVGVLATYKVAKAVSLPVIGVGGIAKATDIIQYVIAGASLIAVGTAVMQQPRLAGKLVDDLDRIADAADMYGIDLTIVGPELPLAIGLADRLRAEGRAVLGPSAAAAQIEASKAFAKEVMSAAGVRTASSQIFTELEPEITYYVFNVEEKVGGADNPRRHKCGVPGAVCAEHLDREHRTRPANAGDPLVVVRPRSDDARDGGAVTVVVCR